jgi:hypothetical protein
MITLDDALKIKAWTPLRAVAANASEVLPKVFALSENLFVQTQPYGAQGQKDLPDAPFITVLYWAPSVQVLKRIVSRDPSVLIAVVTTPPSELVSGTDGTYSELKGRIPQSRSKIAETGAYDLKGRFLYKQINVPPFTWYFVSPNAEAEEITVLVAVRLER